MQNESTIAERSIKQIVSSPAATADQVVVAVVGLAITAELRRIARALESDATA